MHVRLTHLDGKLPNLALMRLAAWHRSRGDTVYFTHRPERDMLEAPYDAVYGSAIFQRSALLIARLRAEFPTAIIGGTGSDSAVEVEDIIHGDAGLDYSLYPRFDGSLGFTQRGCRLKCGFCVVPKKEGSPRSVSTIADIWRGEPWPKHLHLLDNDFFGQAEWLARAEEIIDGGFKVCLNQGINIRMVDERVATVLAALPYYDDQFKTRRLYTAWDNIGDERRFFDGVERLERHGVPPRHLMVYMLIGYDRRETWERVFYRFEKMVALGIRPYPMVFGDRDRTLPLGGHNARISRRTLGEFQRWAIRKAYTFVPFAEYDVNAKGHTDTRQPSLFAVH